MKYTFAYKTSDGVRHEDSLDAESRDEAFAILRGRGIRPIKVVAADGSKANGEVRGLRNCDPPEEVRQLVESYKDYIRPLFAKQRKAGKGSAADLRGEA